MAGCILSFNDAWTLKVKVCYSGIVAKYFNITVTSVKQQGTHNFLVQCYVTSCFYRKEIMEQ